MSNITLIAKRLAKMALGKDFFTRVDCKYSKDRFGSEYGGWDIVVEFINAGSVVYSFGVGEDATFDTGMINRFGLAVHAFDPTPKSIEWVKKQHFPGNFIMHEYGIAEFDGEILFHPPENPDHISHTVLNRPATENRAIKVPVKRLATIMRELGHSNIDVLKMDIEGAEYAVIDDIRISEIRPRQILIEFHHKFPNVGVNMSKEYINKVRNMGYHLFSVSKTGEEYSFIRKTVSNGAVPDYYPTTR